MHHCQHHCHQLRCSACHPVCWVDCDVSIAAALAVLAALVHLLLLLASHLIQRQLLLLRSSTQRGWAACHLPVRAAAAPAVPSAGQPLQLLLQLHPALAGVKTQLLLLLLGHHLAAQLLPATYQCTACAVQVALQGLLQSAACSPPAQHLATLLLLLLEIQEHSAPPPLKAAAQLTATSCSKQSACLEAPEHHCQQLQLLLQQQLQTALHLALFQAWIRYALEG
jgi:hypothetical protein